MSANSDDRKTAMHLLERMFGVEMSFLNSDASHAALRRAKRELAEIFRRRAAAFRELARRAGDPGSARAAGAATGRNPIGIIVPCHRVVGSDGNLTGYAGGLECKGILLALEGADPVWLSAA